MSANREKSTRVMGFVVSILLHGIFIAGCIALDYSAQPMTADEAPATEVNSVADHHDQKPKS